MEAMTYPTKKAATKVATGDMGLAAGTFQVVKVDGGWDIVHPLAQVTPPAEDEQQKAGDTEGTMTDEQVQVTRSRIQALKAETAQLEGLLAQQQNHVLWTSTAVKPVSLVRELFVAAVVAGTLKRKTVVDACIAAGVAANTAKTQYQILKGKLERGELDEEVAEFVAVIEAE